MPANPSDPLAQPLSPLSCKLLDAISNNRSIEAARLLSRGASPLAREGLGPTPLLAAVSAGFREGSQACIRLLAGKGGLKERDANGRTPLLLAAWRGLHWALPELAYPGWETDTDKEGNSASALAANYAPCLEWILANGGDCRSPNTAGFTPLMLANYAGAQILLSHHPKIDPDAQNLAGRTALMMAAARGGSPAYMRLLLAHTRDPNIRDIRTGSTALHLALTRFHFETAAVLATACDLTARDHDGRTPVSLSCVSSATAAQLWPLLIAKSADDIDAVGMREALGAEESISAISSPSQPLSKPPLSKFGRFLAESIHRLEEAKALQEATPEPQRRSPSSRL